jgi:hypothetical protein
MGGVKVTSERRREGVFEIISERGMLTNVCRSKCQQHIGTSSAAYCKAKNEYTRHRQESFAS